MTTLSDNEILGCWEELNADGMTRKEAAEHLGLSESSLNNKIFRARRGETSNPENQKDKISVNGWDNYLEIDAKTKRIHTLDDLIEACEIDLDEWIIEKHIINKWEVGSKPAKNLPLQIKPLIQVKAWLVKRYPEQIRIETVHPVLYKLPKPPKVRARRSKYKSALLIPDIHTGFLREHETGDLDPFHDRRALDVILQIVSDHKFDEIGYLGDLADLPDWTDKFLRSPEFYWCTQPAIDELAWWMSQIRWASPGSRQWVIPGNHEKRMDTAIVTHLLAAYKLRPASDVDITPAMSMPRLLGVSDMGVEWIGDYPNASVWLNDNIECIHGEIARGASGDTARAMVRVVDHSVIFGHIHRDEKASRTLHKRGGRHVIRAVSPGCMCRIDGVVPAKKKNQNWQQGAAVARYDDSGYNSIDVITIENGRAIFEGKVYEARDRSKDLPASVI